MTIIDVPKVANYTIVKRRTVLHRTFEEPFSCPNHYGIAIHFVDRYRTTHRYYFRYIHFFFCSSLLFIGRFSRYFSFTVYCVHNDGLRLIPFSLIFAMAFMRLSFYLFCRLLCVCVLFFRHRLLARKTSKLNLKYSCSTQRLSVNCDEHIGEF